MGLKNIQERIKNKESIYNLCLDKRKNQFSKGVKLDTLHIDELPDYVKNNKKIFERWLD